MVSLTKITSRDFGEALRAARQKAGVTLESISARTKISVRQLAALENGEFRQLPNQTFAKIFLRQYLELIQAAPENWLQAFDVAWRRLADSSQTFTVGPAIPVRRRRVGPWIVSLLLVSGAVAGVFLVERRQQASGTQALVRTPELRTPVAPAPTHAPTTVPDLQPEATERPSQPGVLVIRTGDAPSWVEVRVAGERPSSRLMPSSTAWDVDAGGREVDLVLGDAGAVSLEYLGQQRTPAGRPGEVAHIHLQVPPTPPTGQ